MPNRSSQRLPCNDVMALAFVTFILFGCRTVTPPEKSAQQLRIESKQHRYLDLLNALRDQTLPMGSTAAKIRETFGEPDDIFSSGSSVSSMAIWTYEKVTRKDEETWEPIKLYFNDGVLISAKY